jgi:hypothetical protein
MAAAPTELRPAIIALVILALAAVAVYVYAPGLNGVFVFDSVERVIRSESLRMDSFGIEQLLGAAYAAQSDYPQRGLAYVTLALNYFLADQQFEPFAFKLTNLIIHIANALLVVVLARLILSRWRQSDVIDVGRVDSPPVAALAVLAMALWLLHPIQLTSVLYVVQRMTSLAATWVLIGSILFMLARARFQQRRRYALALMFGSVIVCTGMGFLCKQSALLLPAYIAVLELFLFERNGLSAAQKRGLLCYFGVTLAIPAMAGVVVLLTHPEFITAGYESRDFNMPQRLMTQARVMFFYLGLLLIPDIRRFGLYHDDIATSTGLLDPLTTIAALTAWAVVLLAILWGARRRAPWAFAAAWFVVGHGMESTILPLEQVHEHRNYAPSAGLWIAVAYYAGTVWERAGRMRPLVLVAMGVWILSLALVSHLRAQAWQNPATLMESLARHHPESYRSVVGYAFNSLPANTDLLVRFDAFKRAAMLNDGVVVPLMEMAKLATVVDFFIGSESLTSRSGSGESSGIPIPDMRLLADAVHNARLLDALDKEINRRLSSEVVRTESVAALVALVDCALNGNRECNSLREKSMRWHDSATSNARLPADYNAVLELSLAKIHAVTGEYDAAVRHARRAGQLAADNLGYRLQEATLYALLGRWDDLSVVLNEVEKRFPVRANSDPMFRDLRSRYVDGEN